MDFARIIREIEEEILRLEQIKSLLKGESPAGNTAHREKELSPEKQEKSAEDSYTPPHSS
jgi:hypothetical protein